MRLLYVRYTVFLLVTFVFHVGIFCYSISDVGAQTGSKNELRTLNSYFPFEVPDSVEAWEKRKSRLKRHVQMSLGLWPMPAKCDLNAVIHGRIETDDYTIEKVYFESFPGFYVTGNLYRPKNHQGKTAGILCPHGHYRDGRFRETPQKEIEAMIKRGEEKLKSNARSPLQARCAHLARMGCTVFHYDMLGYADSVQIPYSIAHGFRDPRPHLNKPDAYGFFSPQAESHLQSIMGLQTWNSIRALDFLESLSEVDPSRIGVTGSSGGGTQTFILCAIDPRPSACFPAVMVSTGMQGGCTCENCCNLRVGTGNVEIAALFAPKPMALSAADDWTKEMRAKGFPELSQLYEMLGKPENVRLTETLQFPHGYNQVARKAMYEWFNEHLELNDDVNERESQFFSKQDLTVWNSEHPRPESGEGIEVEVLKNWRLARADKVRALLMDEIDRSQLCESLLGIKRPEQVLMPSLLEIELPEGQSLDRFLVLHDGDSESSEDQELELYTLQEAIENKDLVHYSRLSPIDLLPEGQRENRLVENGRKAAGYTYGYNQSTTAESVFSIERVIETVAGIHDDRNDRLTIIALDNSAMLAPIAAALVDYENVRLVVNSRDRRFDQIGSLTDRYFLPGGSVLGDLPGFLAMNAPREMLVFGNESELAVVKKAYDAKGKAKNLTISDETDRKKVLEQLIDWIE